MPVVPASLSLVVGGIALHMTWRTYQYNQKKDAKARAQSIQDDFWIRKVVSPASVEPFLKLVVTLRQTLPSATMQEPSRADAVKTYWADEAKNLNALSSGFCSLELIDSSLHKKVEDTLREFEEGLSIYIGSLLGFIIEGGTPPPNREDAIKEMNECMLRVFRHIQTHQQTLGLHDEGSDKAGWWQCIWIAGKQKLCKSKAQTRNSHG